MCPEWRLAMNREFDALIQSQTWTLVLPRDDMNIIGSKWVYHIKSHVDGRIERFKARLIAKG